MKIPPVLLALAVGVALLAGCVMAVPPQASTQMVEPDAAHWKTWVLPAADALRPEAPPDQAATQAEIAQLKDLASQRDAAAEAQVAYWDAGSPSYRWIQIALDHFHTKPVGGPPRTFRALALMNVAIYDAMVAAWDAKYAYNRPRPSQVDPTLTPLVAVPNSPSYPSEQAVAAGAAAAILSYFYPDEADALAAQAEEAAQSRVLAGVQYPSDAQAGLELGRHVAEQVIARAMADGSDAKWDGTRPTGPAYFTGEKPAEPMAGSWQTWLMSSGDEFRPPAPYAYDSPELAAEIQEIQGVTHTWQMDSNILWWQSDEGVYNYFYDLTSRLIFENHLDTNPPQAARIYALPSVARYDGMVGCFDTKYTYWAIRPYEVDPSIKPFFPTPHPSYPSGHSCTSGAFLDTLAYLFPDQATYLDGVLHNISDSRVQGGIHYRQDVDAGMELARKVADLAVQRDQVMTQP